MSFNLNNPFSEKRILGPGETDPKADVELARTLLGDEAAEEYAEALKGDARGETLSDGLTDEEKAAIAKHAEELAAWKAERERIPGKRFELTIGGIDKINLLTDMGTKGITMSDRAYSLIDRITFSSTEEKLTLVQLSVAELGFPEGAEDEVIYERVKERGLELVPAEAALHYCLEYNTITEANLFVGMEPVRTRGIGGEIFIIDHVGSGIIINTGLMYREITRPSRQKFLFRLPTAQTSVLNVKTRL